MKKILSALLAVVLLLTVIPPTFIGDSLTVSADNIADSEVPASELGGYNAYLSSNSGKAHPNVNIKGTTTSAVTEKDGTYRLFAHGGNGLTYEQREYFLEKFNGLFSLLFSCCYIFFAANIYVIAPILRIC